MIGPRRSMEEENRVETRSLKRKREASPEDPKAEDLIAKEQSKKPARRYQPGWGRRNGPLMPDPEDYKAHRKAVREGKLFDIPVSNSGYRINAIRPLVKDIEDPFLLELAKLAIQAYNEKKEEKYVAEEVEKTCIKFSSAFTYYITFKASCAGKDSISFQAEVTNFSQTDSVVVNMVRKSGDEDCDLISRLFTGQHLRRRA